MNGLAPSIQAATQTGRPRRNVAAKAGRDLDAGVDVPVCEPLFEIGIIGKRRFFDKVGRAAQLLEIGAAFMAMVVVENSEGEIVYVGRDAEAENKHQKRRAEQGKAEPDRIAQQFQRLADRAGEKALQTEGRARSLAGRSRYLLGRRGELSDCGDAMRSRSLLEDRLMNASSRVAAPRAAIRAAGAAVASTRPESISEIRSQRSASFMKWVETKIVTP